MAFRDLLENRYRSLRSWAFHVSSESHDSRRIKSLKVLLNRPGVCYSVDEVTLGDAAHVMEDDFRRMQHEIHSGEHGAYCQEVSEVLSRIDYDAGGVYRFKVLVDLGVLDEKGVEDLIKDVEELRKQ